VPESAARVFSHQAADGMVTDVGRDRPFEPGEELIVTLLNDGVVEIPAVYTESPEPMIFPDDEAGRVAAEQCLRDLV